MALEQFIDNIIESYNSESKQAKRIANYMSLFISDRIKKLEGITKNGISKLADFDDKEIMNIINDFDYEDEEITENDILEALSNPNYDHSKGRKDLFYKILQIKYVLQYSSSFDSSFDKIQKEALDTFISKYKFQLERQKKELDRIKSNSNNKNEERLDLEELSKKVKEKSGFIDEFDFFDENLISKDYSEEYKTDVLLDIFDHNQKKFNDIMGSMKNMKFKEKINEEELEVVLNKYGYSLKELIINENNRFYIDLLLEEGNLDNIDSVLKRLSEIFSFRKVLPIKDEREKRAFVSVLCQSNIEIINFVFDEIEKYGFNRDIVLSNPCILFAQSEGSFVRREITNQGDSPSVFLTGRAIDFSDNLQFFLEKGFNMDKIRERGLTAVTSSNNLIKYNYDIMYLYGVPAVVKQEFENFNNTSAFISTHTADIFDKFIELGNVGYEYITRFLSRLKVTDPNHSLFYELKKQSRELDNFGPANIRRLARDLFTIDSTEKEYLDEQYNIVTPTEKQKYGKIVEERLFDRKKKWYYGNPDKNLGNELFDNSILENEYVKRIDQEAKTNNPYIYNINGVIISRNKFLKVFNLLQDKTEEDLKGVIIYSLTHNSLITEEEYKNISKYVSNMLNEKRMG